MTAIIPIYEIVRKIVMQHPPIAGKPQLNTFAVKPISALMSENLDAIMQDFHNNRFWARHWVDSGAVIDNLKRNYDVCLLYPIETSFQKIEINNSKTRYALNVITYDNENPKRDELEMKMDCVRLVHYVYEQIDAHNLFKIQKGSVIRESYLTLAECEHLKAKGAIDSFALSQKQFFCQNPSEIMAVSKDVDGAVGAQMFFELRNCISHPTPNYDYEAAPTIPRIELCANC